MHSEMKSDASCPSLLSLHTHSFVWFSYTKSTKPPALSRLRAQNALHLLLLILAQGGAENGATVAAELVGHSVAIGGAQKRIDGRVAGLDHGSDLLHKLIGDTEFVLPPGRVEGAPCRAERSPAGSGRRNRPRGRRGTGSAGEGDGERGRDQRAPQPAPARAFLRGHLEALVDAELTVVVAVNGDRVVEVHGPILVHPLQLVKHLGRAVHVFLEANNYQFCHDCSPFNVV